MQTVGSGHPLTEGRIFDPRVPILSRVGTKHVSVLQRVFLVAAERAERSEASEAASSAFDFGMQEDSLLRRNHVQNLRCAATKVLTMRVVTDKCWTHAIAERDKTSEQGTQPTPSNPLPHRILHVAHARSSGVAE